MRVALIQLAASPDTRSAHIARLMRMINKTCERDPAPDLLVLPAGCECSSRNDGHDGITRAMGDTLAGLLAMQAREWGVFIAGGFQTRDGAGPLVRGALFDPDGDVLIRTCRDDDAGRLLARVATTSIGAVGLLLSEHLREKATWNRPEHCEVLAVPGLAQDAETVASGTARPDHTLGRPARRAGCYVCYAFPAPAGAGGVQRQRKAQGPSRIYAPDGAQLARASDREEVLMAELGVGAESGGRQR